MSDQFEHLDLRIARLAGRQHGLVTRGQLLRLGASDGAIRWRRRAGRLHAVHRGVFAVGHTALTGDGRLLAAVMSCGPSASVSHEHAAWLWELLAPWVDQPDLAEVHVTVTSECRRGRRPGIRVHHTRRLETAVVRAIPATTPVRTILDLAATSSRLLEDAIDRAFTADKASPGALREAVATHRGTRGAAALRRALDSFERFDGVSDSELERHFAELVTSAGLPPYERNARVAGMRVDALWPEHGLVVELDGYRWHRTRSRAEADRAREVRLRAAGLAVVRYSARQVFATAPRVIADLAAELAARRVDNANWGART